MRIKGEVKMEMESLWKCTCLKSQKRRSLTAVEPMEELHGGRVISREEEEEEVENGVVRVKIVVSKQELKQLLASMGQRRGNPASLEQLLHGLRERRMERAEAAGEGHRGDWRPELQSIPEEI